MAKDERQLLEQAIEEVRNFDADRRSPYSIEFLFLQLNDADQSDNLELWDELRRALANSRQISRKDPKQFLERPYFSGQGYWWWNPLEWQVPVGSEQ